MGIFLNSSDQWNSVVLSLSMRGGFIRTNGKYSEIHVTELLIDSYNNKKEYKFVKYIVYTTSLKFIYKDIIDLQSEITEHIDDIEEQEKINNNYINICRKKSKNDFEYTFILDDSCQEYIEHDEKYIV
jgi:hypothetical protein